jgi:hypothetical protein
MNARTVAVLLGNYWLANILCFIVVEETYMIIFYSILFYKPC